MNKRSVLERGLKWYGYISQCGYCNQPIRLVIWSWDSDPIRPLADDVRIKAARTTVQSYLLAQFLTEIDPEVRTSLLGYSYGARVIGGTLHLLGGGKLCGRALPSERIDTQPPVRVVMWAAALESDWLLPGHKNGQALCAIDRMLITCNRKDPVLRRYWRLESNPNAVALGYEGFACSNRLGDARKNIKQINVTDSVGRHHQWQKYADDRSIRACTCRYALWR